MSWANFNTLLALVMVAAAINSVANMNGTTRHCIRAGILLILVAGIGQVLGVAIAEWDHWVDTMLYCGVIVLLVFNRRYRKTENVKREPELDSLFTIHDSRK